MATGWEVTDLRVETTTPDHTTDRLYANGLMQVAVIALISAVNKDNGSNYTLTDTELNTIKLVDYYNPTQEISGGWTYTKNENEFDHSLPSAAKEETQTKTDDLHDNFQQKRYWVSTAKVENCNIGASIRQPDGTTVHTSGCGFNSHVTLTSTQPVEYNLTNTELEREDTATGTLNGIKWDQDNYYFSSKIHSFKKAELSGSQSSPGEPTMNECTGRWLLNNSPRFFFMWPMGQAATREAGGHGLQVDIRYNQRAKNLCLTRLLFDGVNLGNGGVYWPGRFKVFDRYGNSGTFWVGYASDRNSLHVQEREWSPYGASGEDPRLKTFVEAYLEDMKK